MFIHLGLEKVDKKTSLLNYQKNMVISLKTGCVYNL